ncbi:MAG TPA: hypothetical protein VMB77_10045 [Syntrophales bacterium]|nr:hypothetical protein [Syntrophales bacterium]
MMSIDPKHQLYRNRRRSCSLLLMLTLFCLHCSSASSNSPVNNVQYVDAVGTNFLFRGERPLTGDGTTSAAFNLDGLRNAISDQAAQSGVVLPPSYTLVIISLLWIDDIQNPTQAAAERGFLIAEFSFFQSNPQLGLVHSWTTRGTKLSPLDPALSSTDRDYLAMNLDSWLIDPLVLRVNTLRSWLENPSPLGITGPAVFYVHCYGGCDRTGELIGSYAMRHMNKSWEEMNLLNKERCRPGTPYNPDNCNALRWYGLWLNLTVNRSVNWDNPANCGE